MGTEAYVGWRGHGKTMLAVERVRKLARARKVPVLANIKLVPGDPLPGFCDQCEPFYQVAYRDDGRLDVRSMAVHVLRFREHGHGAVILLDEAGVMFNSREWQEFPPGLSTLIAQGRKLRVDMVLTSQFVDQLDKTLREMCEVAHKVRAWPAPTVLGRETGRRPWVMSVSSYRPANVDNPEKKLGHAWVLYRRARERVYDTDELVMPPSAILAAMDRKRRRPREPHPPAWETRAVDVVAGLIGGE